MIVAIELSGLREYVRINPQVRNLDTLYAFLVESEIIPSELNERCELGFSMHSRNVEITLQARTEGDEQFCSETSEEIAELIENSRKLLASTILPDSFQFATAAVSGTGSNAEMPAQLAGAIRVTAHSSLILCAILVSIFALMKVHI